MYKHFFSIFSQFLIPTIKELIKDYKARSFIFLSALVEFFNMCNIMCNTVYYCIILYIFAHPIKI